MLNIEYYAHFYEAIIVKSAWSDNFQFALPRPYVSFSENLCKKLFATGSWSDPIELLNRIPGGN